MPNMKQLKYGLIIVILICCGVPMFTSCSTDSADAPPEQPQEQVIPSPRVTSKRYLEVLEKDNLCKGWKPRKDEHILLVHNTSDITVPPSNTVNMAAFLKQQGVEDVKVMMDDFGESFGQPAHETGAVIFMVNAILQVRQTLDIKLWFNLSDINLFSE